MKRPSIGQPKSEAELTMRDLWRSIEEDEAQIRVLSGRIAEKKRKIRTLKKAFGIRGGGGDVLRKEIQK